MCAEFFELICILFNPQVSTFGCIEISQGWHFYGCSLPFQILHICIDLRSLWQIICDIDIVFVWVIELEFGLWPVGLQLGLDRNHCRPWMYAVSMWIWASEWFILVRWAYIAVFFTFVKVVLVIVIHASMIFHDFFTDKSLTVYSFQLIWHW